VASYGSTISIVATIFFFFLVYKMGKMTIILNAKKARDIWSLMNYTLKAEYFISLSQNKRDVHI